eukprot:6380042-Alexandrium_andersonii.AAC.1
MVGSEGLAVSVLEGGVFVADGAVRKLDGRNNFAFLNTTSELGSLLLMKGRREITEDVLGGRAWPCGFEGDQMKSRPGRTGLNHR